MGLKKIRHPIWLFLSHYGDVIMGAIASQITSLTIVYSTVYSDADQRKHQSAASLALVRGIHRGPVNSPHKWPVTRKMFPFDDFIMLGTQYIPLCVEGFCWVFALFCIRCLYKFRCTASKFLHLFFLIYHQVFYITTFDAHSFSNRP